MLYLALMLTIIFYVIFFITSILGVINDKNRWLVMIVALVHPLVAIPIAFFIFYKGYQGICMGLGYFKFYKLAESLVITIGFFVFFLSLFGYHGPLFLVFQLGEKNKFKPLIIMTALEIITFLLGIGVRISCLLQVQTEFDVEKDELML